MTVNTTNSAITVSANSSVSYSFNFIGVSAANIQVLYTNTAGTITTVSPTAYTVSINAPVTGQIWGVGGTISPLVPANYSSGSLTISRILPFTQTAEISNQGNQYPTVTEQAIDIQCMESQQIAARTGAYRGVWVSGAIYNFGDIVQDGINGAYTNNIYVCSNANTSTTWSANLASGYWQLSISVATLQPPGSFLPLTGGTISGNLTVSGTTALAAINASGTITGNVTGNTSGSTVAASTSIKLNGSPVIDKVVVQKLTSSGPYTPTPGMQYCIIEMVGGGGGSGGSTGAGSQSAVAGSGGGAAGMKLLATAANIAGSTATVTIGAAGAAGASGNNAGGAGGNTSIVINSSTWTAGGGGAGGGQASSASLQGSGTAGAGGTNTTGDNATILLNMAGQSAGFGVSVGSSGVFSAPSGGSSYLGLGAPTTATTTLAASGTGFGAGAAAGANGTGGSIAGAAGTIGYVVITEYVSA